jgi:hypothetical protein
MAPLPFQWDLPAIRKQQQDVWIAYQTSSHTIPGEQMEH